MADAKRCDRCGKYYVEEEKKYQVDGNILASIKFICSKNCMFGRFDLCDDCAEKLDRFMNKEKEEEKGSAGKIEMGESVDILPCICGKQPTHRTWYGPDMFERHNLYCRDCGIAAVTSNYVIEAAKNWNKKIGDIMAMRGEI